MSEDTENAADTKACPVCGEQIKKVAIKCRFCGEDLQKFAEQQEAAVEKDIYSGHPAIAYRFGQWVWMVLTLGIAWFVYWYRSRTMTFHITTQRIRIDKGFFSKSTSTMEIFRIDDFDLSLPLSMRMLGYGLLRIQSSDRHMPNITLYGIKNINDLYEQLRECALRERERRGVKVWADA